jgi:predicted permease
MLLARIRALIARLGGLARPRRTEVDLDEEIATHLELLTDDLRRRGLSPADARTAAHRAFGGADQMKEEWRDQQALPMLDAFLRDTRVGVRRVAHAPGFAIASSLSLALGISAATIVYGWVSAVLTAAAPIADMDRLVGVWLHNRAQSETKTVVSAADFDAWRRRQTAFDLLVAQRSGSANVSGGVEPVRVQSAWVTADYFQLFSARPVLGREFTSDDERPGAARIALLGDRFWRDRWAGRGDVLGQQIRVDGAAATIVGVLPRNDYSPDLLMPLTLDPAAPDYRERALFVSARLKPAVTLDEARMTMQAIGEQLEREEPDAYRGWSINTRPLQEEFVGSQARLIFALLAASAGAVLLIACINIANLMLARGLSRARELALRTALGASRSRLVRQMLAESAALAAAGGALGLLAAWWGLQLMRGWFQAGAPYMERAAIDARVLAFALGATLLSALLFALLPALAATRETHMGALREGGRGTGSPSTRRLRGALVCGEVAGATLLVILALFFLRTLAAIRALPPGFETRNLLTWRLALPRAAYASDASVAAFYDRLLARAAAMPGAVVAGATSRAPTAGGRFNPNRTVIIEGRSAASDDARFADDLTITPGYLEALRVPIREGRAIAASDSVDAPLAAVVNATMARRYWAGTSPLGARIRLGDEPSPDAWRTVVGVAGDIRNDDIDAPTLPQVFVPLAQRPERDMTVVVRTADNPIAHVGDARAAVAMIDRNQPLFDVRSMDQLLEEDVRGTVVLVGLASIFGVVSLALAATGIYGVLAYSVAQSTREIGIRMALGSTASAVLARVIRQGLGPVLIGLSMGLAAAAGLSRALAGILFGVSSSDPATYAAAMAVMIGTALLACVIPAGRAARTDPLVALRCE